MSLASMMASRSGRPARGASAPLTRVSGTAKGILIGTGGSSVRVGLREWPMPLGRRLHFIARLTISSLGNAPFGGRAECHTDRSAVGDAAGMAL